MNFWETIDKPIWILAPMEDVTDTVFRQVMMEAGRPMVFFTEFTSVEGMDSKGVEKVEQRLKFTQGERPIVAQIWGKSPEKFYKAAVKIKEMGFDGIDINMGCPDRAVLKQGCGAALVEKENRENVKEIIQATKSGGSGLPVSVKTRLGNRKKEEGWVEFLLEQDLPLLTMHGRTAKDMSEVPAKWEEIGEVRELRDKMKVKTLIVGNGDVKNLVEAREKVERYGVDGVMIGREIFENPWLFAELGPSKEKNIKLLDHHVRLWADTWGERKQFAVLKKYFKMYVRGWEGAAELRAKLMETNNLDQVEKVLSGDV